MVEFLLAVIAVLLTGLLGVGSWLALKVNEVLPRLLVLETEHAQRGKLCPLHGPIKEGI